MYMTLEWYTNGISGKQFELFQYYKNCCINFSVLKADDEIKS